MIVNVDVVGRMADCLLGMIIRNSTKSYNVNATSNRIVVPLMVSPH